MDDNTVIPKLQARQTSRVQYDKRMAGILSEQLLRRQNVDYAGTGGISQNNRSAGFVPGYFDRESGVAVVSRFADGSQAPIHVLDGLPETWVVQRGAHGQVISARPGVVAGFLRNGRFYTRAEAARALAQ